MKSQDVKKSLNGEVTGVRIIKINLEIETPFFYLLRR